MSVVLVALSNNWTQIAFDVYAPLYYVEVFEVDPRDSGKLMSGIRSVGMVMPFLAVFIEERMVASGVTPRRMRQLGTGGALTIVAIACTSLGCFPPTCITPVYQPTLKRARPGRQMLVYIYIKLEIVLFFRTVSLLVEMVPVFQ